METDWDGALQADIAEIDAARLLADATFSMRITEAAASP
jgi:hypothetical protein